MLIVYPLDGYFVGFVGLQNKMCVVVTYWLQINAVNE